MSCLCFRFISLQQLKLFLSYSAKKIGAMKKTFLCAEETPLGEITQDDDIIKSACTEGGGKGGSGCKGDGIETGNGWARFELGRIGFNAVVMAADGFNPFAGFSFPHRFLIKSIPAMTSKRVEKKKPNNNN